MKKYNREIKFRVWDGNKFYNSVSLYDMQAGYPSVEAPCFASDLIFQQSTELFDRNGAEIYEGDILKVLNCVGIVTYLPKALCYTLRHPASKDYRLDLHLECNDNYFCDIGRFTVVGNILENPNYFNE